MARRTLLAALSAALALAPAAGGSGFPVGLDLARGTVNGHALLGRTLAEVVAAFGRPDGSFRGSSLEYVRWGSPQTFSLLVLLRGGRVVSVAFQDPSLVEVRTGRLVALAPPALQRALRQRYRGKLRLAEPYECHGGGECDGRFESVRGALDIRFGLAGPHTFLSIGRH